MKKIILYSLGILVALLLIAGIVAVRFMNNFLFRESPDYLTFSIDSTRIDLEWAEQDYGNYIEPHGAILIPIKLEGLPHKFYFQFDTGAPTTMIYGKPLKSLQSIQKDYKVVEKEEKKYLKSFSGELGGSHLDANMIQIFENFGNPIDLNDTIKHFKLGTIGADFLDNRISVIDFKNQFMQLYQNRPDWMSNFQEFQRFEFKGRRFVLPAEIAGKKLDLFYDSGSSGFGLMTSRNRYKKFSNKDADEVKFDANSWGDKIPIYHKSSDAPLIIGGADLKLKKVSYVDMYAGTQRFLAPLSKIGGLLGNKPFVDCTLIFDTKTEEFLVLTGDERMSLTP